MWIAESANKPLGFNMLFFQARIKDKSQKILVTPTFGNINKRIHVEDRMTLVITLKVASVFIPLSSNKRKNYEKIKNFLDYQNIIIECTKGIERCIQAKINDNKRLSWKGNHSHENWFKKWELKYVVKWKKLQKDKSKCSVVKVFVKLD